MYGSEGLPKQQTEKCSVRSKSAPQQFLGQDSMWLRIGLYGSTTRNDLDTIRRIRNVFAHTTNPITFETDAIKASCENLKLPSKIRPSEIPLPNFILNPSGSKERFVSTTLIIMGQLRLELAEGKNSPTGPISLP